MNAPPHGHARNLADWEIMKRQYAEKRRAALAGGSETDLEVAFNTAMLMRDQLNHEAVLETARDRIRWLSVQLAAAGEIIKKQYDICAGFDAMSEGDLADMGLLLDRLEIG